MKMLPVLLVLVSTQVFGASPLLTKVISNGATEIGLPEFHLQSTTCSVYADKVEISHLAGGVTATTTVPVSLSVNLRKLIGDANTGKITQVHPKLGSGLTSWTALLTVDGVLTKIPLKGEGTTITENDSQSVRPLVFLLDRLCK